MAFTYRWQNVIDLVKKQVKNIPTQQIDAIQCDWVSGLIAEKLPWKALQQTIAPGQIPLIDNQQDYDPPFNISKLTEASLCRTSDTPGEDISLNILDSLARDPRRRSVYAITSIALQAGEGKLRLVSAVAVPVNQTWELRGQYEINPTKVMSLEQGLWFDDKYVHLAIEGLKYCYFQMADDPRAGSVSATGLGDSQYTGQIATFVSALKRMADAETRNLDQQTMPDAPLGIASRQYGAMIAGYGFGFGGGTGTQIAGLVSINNDTTPAQWLVGGPGISITSSGIGSTLISYIGGGGGGGGLGGVAFADDEVVSGSGTSFVLLNTPNPPGSLQLFQFLPGFGSVLLRENIDYTISGTIITTLNTIPAGNLTAWYRYGAVTPPPVVVPTVTSVSPSSGPANTATPVTITGTNFASPATVTFGGAAATGVTVVNPTTITCTTPAHAAGVVAVAVTVSGQTGSLTNGYTYVAAVQPIYGGVGASVLIGTAGVNVQGGTVYLNTGEALTQLQATAETVGQSFGPFAPNNQSIYLLLRGGTHTFLDQNNNTFAMDPPIPQTVSGATMYLYPSTNALYLTWTIKIAS